MHVIHDALPIFVDHMQLDASVQRSSSDKWNAAPSRIVEGSPKSIFREIVEKSDSSERMNLANSLSVHTPELVLIRHTPMQTDNVGKRRGDDVATRIADQDGIWRPTLRNIKTAPTHGNVETRNEKLAYRKFIKDSEFETEKLFERENIERKNIRNIETRLKMTRPDENQMTRSENNSTRSEEHEPKVNVDPDPSSSDSSDSSSSDSAPKRKKSKKKKKRRKHRKDDSSEPSSSNDSDSSEDSYYRRKRRKDKNIGKRIRSDYAQL